MRLGIDTSVASALQADLMLQSAVLPIRVCCRDGNLTPNQTEVCRDAEERDVAGIAGKLAMRVTVRKHEILDGKLDIDHTARIVLEIEQRASVGMTDEEFAPHRVNFALELVRIARQLQNRFAF